MNAEFQKLVNVYTLKYFIFILEKYILKYKHLKMKSFCKLIIL